VPDVDASSFCSWDEDVIAAHEGGTRDPADLCLSQGHALWPTCFGRPLRQDSVQGCLDLAIGAVAAEHTAVWRTWQNNVASGVYCLLRRSEERRVGKEGGAR